MNLKSENVTAGNGNLLKMLLTHFPPFLLALILFPTITGLLINYDLVDFGEPLRILAITTLFMVLRHLSQKNIIYYIVAILLFVNGFIMLMHWLMLKGPMSATSLFVVFNTNYEEAVGFFKLKGNYGFFLIIPFVLIFVLSLIYTFKTPRLRMKRNYTVMLMATLLAIGFIGLQVARGGAREGMPLVVKSSVLFYKEVQAFQILKNDTKKRLSAIKADAPMLEQPQVLVLIKGESTNRNHIGLYGYYRDTSPHLIKRNDILVYNDVVSAYTMTLESISAALTEANLENKKKSYESYNLMEVFRSAGVKTYWLSNQSPLGVWDNLVTLLAQQSDVTDFVNVVSNSSLDSFKKTSYDGKLFSSLLTALADDAPRKFIVVHLMGSHATYAKRYPPEFDKFKGITSNEKIIAAYDNSILYNDFVVDSLLNILSSYSTQNHAVSSAIYLSDHGENVYDDADYAGHDYTESVPKSIVEIPFLVWLSPGYMEVYPERSETIINHRTDPFVTDDLFHSALDIYGIKTSVLDTTRSVFNAGYNSGRKRVLVDGNDYDEK